MMTTLKTQDHQSNQATLTPTPTEWMAILNLSSDSFSNDGLSLQGLQTRLDELKHTSVDWLDIGAVSTRPGALPLTPEEEWKRIHPALGMIERFQILRNQMKMPVRLSLDTSSPIVAARVSEILKIDLINDVYAGRKVEDGQSTINVAAKINSGIALMHMQNHPQNMQQEPLYQNCTQEIVTFLKERARAALQLNIEKIVVDPGIGFGKALAHNLEILSASFFEKLRTEIQTVSPAIKILVGLSRKRFLWESETEPQKKELLLVPSNRDKMTKEWEQMSITFGADMIRTHRMPSEVVI